MRIRTRTYASRPRARAHSHARVHGDTALRTSPRASTILERLDQLAQARSPLCRTPDLHTGDNPFEKYRERHVLEVNEKGRCAPEALVQEIEVLKSTDLWRSRHKFCPQMKMASLGGEETSDPSHENGNPFTLAVSIAELSTRKLRLQPLLDVLIDQGLDILGRRRLTLEVLIPAASMFAIVHFQLPMAASG